jgi:hypothetical protein
MDEVFGRRNFIANLVWQKRTSRENRKAVGSAHDHILVYARKSPSEWKEYRNLEPDTDAGYANPEFLSMRARARPNGKSIAIWNQIRTQDTQILMATLKVAGALFLSAPKGIGPIKCIPFQPQREPSFHRRKDAAGARQNPNSNAIDQKGEFIGRKAARADHVSRNTNGKIPALHR